MKAWLLLMAWPALALGTSLAQSQIPSSAGQPNLARLTETGQVLMAGHAASYLIRHLPVGSFPELPAAIADQLNRRGCLIPQTYEAHHPENVVHASLVRAGSSDWAVLCSVDGKASLLVFFDGQGKSQSSPLVLASAAETDHLQTHDSSGVLGFNWGIDQATPAEVHQAQAGMEKRPAGIDHDALAESVVEHKTVYHFYAKGSWNLLEMPE